MCVCVSFCSCVCETVRERKESWRAASRCALGHCFKRKLEADVKMWAQPTVPVSVCVQV